MVVARTKEIYELIKNQPWHKKTYTQTNLFSEKIIGVTFRIHIKFFDAKTNQEESPFSFFAKCGKFKYFTVTKIENGEAIHIQWKRCYFHKINICRCGWQFFHHFDDDRSPTLHSRKNNFDNYVN